jgi:glycosyltransferase involved in cell wall biosynthesis
MERTLLSTIRLSVAAPAYNEGQAIEQTVIEWVTYLSGAKRVSEFEIVVCNDGSRDDTGAVLDRLSQRHSQVRPVHFQQNVGAAAALRAAIRNTRLDWILLIDSDGQFKISDLDRLLEAIDASGALAAIGERKKADGLIARFGSWSSGRLCGWAHGVRLRDFNSAFKLVNGEQLRGLTLEAIGLNYSTEITSRLLERGATIVETPIGHNPRVAGVSSARLLKTSFQRAMFVVYVLLRRFLINSKIIAA